MRRGLLLLVVAACQAPAPPPATPPEMPLPNVRNVVLVTIDTLRADALDVYGGPARTPHLGALAARGWLFERCISASMLTNPSHASIMTSLWPRDHGVYDNESGVADGVNTLAGQLHRHGLRTAAIVGFRHLNAGVANLAQGFDLYRDAPRSERRAADTGAEALALLDDLGPTQPFFLWVHIVDPHAPYEPEADAAVRAVNLGASASMKQIVRAAPGVQRNNPWFKKIFKSDLDGANLVGRYIAEVEAADAGLGVLLAGLASRGLDDDTAVVVTSDHGENLGERDLHFHHGGLYDQTVHVPLVIGLPAGAQGGPRRVAGLVSSVDIAPTVLELVGAPRWEPMRGWSLSPMAWRGQLCRGQAFSEHLEAQLVSVRSGDGTLILHRKSSKMFPSYPFVAGRREVFGPEDGGQAHDLGGAGKHALALDGVLQQFLGVGNLMSARPAVGQDRESLRALGYIE